MVLLIISKNTTSFLTSSQPVAHSEHHTNHEQGISIEEALDLLIELSAQTAI